jgi:Ni/Co efflux regulator RcnB
MKRFATAVLAVLTLTGTMAGGANAEPQRGQLQGREHNDRNDRNNNNNNANRWDQSRYNGYYANGRFNYGPPPASAMNRRDYRPAYQQWRRGQVLTPYYRTHYREVDFRREHLRAPPRGYHYVRDERGQTLLVAIATGAILSILLSN